MARSAVVAAIAMAVGLAPSWTSANGGAYIVVEGTHHLPGEQVTAELYVSIPEGKRDLLDRGPFYAYVLADGGRIEAGRPIPAGAIRVGTFTVMEDGKDTELRVTFTVPDVEGDFYDVGLCNDPCTVAGFGEPVYGNISIVATEREARLLRDNGQLHSRLAGLRRDLRKAERAAEEQAAAAAEALDVSEEGRRAFEEQVRTLEARLAVAEEAAARPRIDPWVAGAVVMAVALAIVGRAVLRRHRAANVNRGVVPEGA